MNVYACKENKVAGLIFCTFESEHGKIEYVFDTYTDGDARNMIKATAEFFGETFTIDRFWDDNGCQADFRDDLSGIANGHYYLESYSWDVADEMLEWSEWQKLVASALMNAARLLGYREA